MLCHVIFISFIKSILFLLLLNDSKLEGRIESEEALKSLHNSFRVIYTITRWAHILNARVNSIFNHVWCAR